MEHQSICSECGTYYVSHNSRGEYCSNACKMKAYRRKKAEADPEIKPRQPSENETATDKPLSPGEEQMQQFSQMLEEKNQQLEDGQIKRAEMLKKLNQYEAVYRIISENRQLLLERQQQLQKEHGKWTNVPFLATSIGILAPQLWWQRLVGGIIGYSLDAALNNRQVKRIDHTLQLAGVQESLRRYSKDKWTAAFHQLQAARQLLTQMDTYISQLTKDIEQLQTQQSQLKKELDNPKADLSDLLDEDGFLSGLQISRVSFSHRIKLPGDLGVFLGLLPKTERCGITLSGVQGSGKTSLAFDIAGKMCTAGLSVAYLSIEMGISDLIKEIVIQYGLNEVPHFKLRENASLADIKRFAEKFDIIIIDSWGKLSDAEQEDFDALRQTFKSTKFIAIFQQTTSGSIRGGNRPLFDADINIETYIEDGQRIAVCSKNRFGKPGLKYSMDEQKILE